MRQHIYADNAATTKLDKEAFEAMIPWLTEEYANPSQPYFFAKKPKMAIKNAREIIAECIGAEPEQIFFTSGGTESDNWAVKCFGASPGGVRVIVTSSIEHHAVLNACESQKSHNSIIYLPVDKYGVVSPDDLDKALDRTGKPICTSMILLTSIMLANNEIGTIQPIKKLAEVAHNRGSAFHTDAVQAIGHIPVNVKELGVDLLSASAHKFNGPKGIGFFYDSGKHVYPHNDGGSQEDGMRAGTENVASIVGMAVALKNNCAQIVENQRHIRVLEDRFMNLMHQSGLDFIRNGSENHLPGLISLSFKNQDGEKLLHRLDLMGISVSTGAACDTKNTAISHVLKAIKIDDDYAEGTIRVSLGKTNSLDDCEKIVTSLKRIILE